MSRVETPLDFGPPCRQGTLFPPFFGSFRVRKPMPCVLCGTKKGNAGGGDLAHSFERGRWSPPPPPSFPPTLPDPPHGAPGPLQGAPHARFPPLSWGRIVHGPGARAGAWPGVSVGQCGLEENRRGETRCLGALRPTSGGWALPHAASSRVAMCAHPPHQAPRGASTPPWTALARGRCTPDHPTTHQLQTCGPLFPKGSPWPLGCPSPKKREKDSEALGRHTHLGGKPARRPQNMWPWL